MKCDKCGKEFDQELERLEFNKTTGGKPSYDEMGLTFISTCKDCKEEGMQKLINEVRRYVNPIR